MTLVGVNDFFVVSSTSFLLFLNFLLLLFCFCFVICKNKKQFIGNYNVF